MYEVVITAIQSSLDPDASARTIQEHTKQDLVTARACIESVLEGGEMILFVQNLSLALSLAEKLTRLGAIAHVRSEA